MILLDVEISPSSFRWPAREANADGVLDAEIDDPQSYSTSSLVQQPREVKSVNTHVKPCTT